MKISFYAPGSPLRTVFGGLFLFGAGFGAGRLREDWDGDFGTYVQLAVVLISLAAGIMQFLPLPRPPSKEALA